MPPSPPNRTSFRLWPPANPPSQTPTDGRSVQAGDRRGGDLGFPLSIHFEATYGYSAPAFDTFADMLAYWSPGVSP